MAILTCRTSHLDNRGLQAIMQAAFQLSESALAEALGPQSVKSGLFQNNVHLLMTAKILDIAVINLDRIMVFWPMMTAHLIEVALHQNVELQVCGLGALTRIVVAALAFPREPPIQESPGLQQAILSPLRNLSSCDSAVAYKRQPECVHHVLDTCGDSLKHARPVVTGVTFDAVTTTRPPPNATTIRIAFDCIKLVVTDFLPIVPLPCYAALLDTILRFGIPNIDLNICLTAIGLLWNVSDYILRHNTKIRDKLTAIAAAAASERDNGTVGASGTVTGARVNGTELGTILQSSSLWIMLFEKLAKLCIDRRSEVRKSANQTLFATVTTHGGLFAQGTWSTFLSGILVPLLKQVSDAVLSADDTAPSGDAAGLMVHHSRNTESKQWEETHVLTLQGAARVFALFLEPLRALPNFFEHCDAILLYVITASSETSDEMAKAAVLALQEICRASLAEGTEAVWQVAWDYWFRMAKDAAARVPLLGMPALTSVIETFPLLCRHLGVNLKSDAVARVVTTIRAISDLRHHDVLSTQTMTNLQKATIDAVICLVPAVPSDTLATALDAAAVTFGGAPDTRFVSMVLKKLAVLAVLASLGCSPPPPSPNGGKTRAGGCVPLALAAIKLLVGLYTRCCTLPDVIETSVVTVILEVLQVPLTKKHTCPARGLWRKAVHTFVAVVHGTVKAMDLHSAITSTDPDVVGRADELWAVITEFLEAGLFADVPAPDELTEADADASLDVKLVHLIRDALLPAAGGERGAIGDGTDYSANHTVHYDKLYDLLRRGTENQHHLSSTTGPAGAGPAKPNTRRLTFAREGFQTLLDTSLAAARREISDSTDDFGAAVNTLLKTCESVLERFAGPHRDAGANAGTSDGDSIAGTIFVLYAVSNLVTPVSCSTS